MTCRDEVLAAANRLRRRGRPVFSPRDVLAEMESEGTQYSPSTIRTHVTSRLCADAPDHHGVVYDDLVRVDRGLYRLKAR
jgi:hypothetical protein